jgi:ABC-type phosphate/phosphonate transport system substrate-binding protein
MPPGWADAAEKTSARQIKIGVVQSVFRDTPPSMVALLSRPLKALMESLTGVSGDLQVGGDAKKLALELKENKVQLGVFHGFEFAWARLHCPELKPLAAAVVVHPTFHAYLIVHKDHPAASAGDLKGKTVALPAISRAHLHLFLERRCPGEGIESKEFFSEVRRPSDPEEALDDVVDGLLDSALVDRVAVERFQKNKPGRWAKLRILHQSEVFPPSVIAYMPGVLDEATLQQFRAGLLNAENSPKSKDLLKLCRITGFIAIPADYEEMLADILKAYPPPLEETKKQR